MRNARLLLSLGLSMLAPSFVGAQSCSVSGTSGRCSPSISLTIPATITNPALLSLTTSTGSTQVTITVPEMDLTDGVNTGMAVTLTVLANRPWTVQIKGNAAFWTSAGGWAAKPVSDLHWSLTPTGASTALTTSNTTVLTGVGGAGTPTTLYFRPVAHFMTDKPGVYSIGSTLTLSTP